VTLVGGRGVHAASRVRSAPVLMTLVGVFFGGTWVAAPWATDELHPLTVAFFRFAVAAVLLWLYCRARSIDVRMTRRDIPVVLGVALTSVAGYNILFLYGVTLAPASHGAVIVPGLIPGATMVLARIVLGERIEQRRALGVAIAVAGLVLVVGPELEAGATTSLGDALFATSAVLWAIYTLIGRVAMHRFHSAAITCLGTAVGAAILLPLAFVVPGGFGDPLTASARAVGSVLYLATFGTVLSFVFFYEGVRQLGAARAAAYAVLVPLFGVTLAVVLLGEPLTPTALVGAAIVLGGLWLAQSPPRAERVRPAESRC
jgi:drug/metabolite transporter (DMT)-like permease